MDIRGLNLSEEDKKFFESIIPADGNMTFTNAVTFGDNPDEKPYLILLSMYPDDTGITSDSYKDWSVKIGRQSTYDYLKEMVKNELVDPSTSFIIAGTDEDNTFKPESNIITIARFLKVMKESNKVLDSEEDFDVDDYISDTYNTKSIFEL